MQRRGGQRFKKLVLVHRRCKETQTLQLVFTTQVVNILEQEQGCIEPLLIGAENRVWCRQRHEVE